MTFIKRYRQGLQWGLITFLVYELFGLVVDGEIMPFWRYLLSFVLFMVGGLLVQKFFPGKKRSGEKI